MIDSTVVNTHQRLDMSKPLFSATAMKVSSECRVYVQCTALVNFGIWLKGDTIGRVTVYGDRVVLVAIENYKAKEYSYEC